jgi:hypothetical protein
MTNDAVLDRRGKRQLRHHVICLPKRDEDADLDWNALALVWTRERLCVDNLRSFVVAWFLPPHDHAQILARTK